MLHEQLKDFQNQQAISNKSFALQLSAIFFIILLVRLYFNFFNILEISLIFFSILFIIISFFKPSFISPIRITFSQIAKILARIINPIVMFIFYLFIFVPFGIILKVFRYDPLNEDINKNLKSYWDSSKKLSERYFKKQF